MRRKNYLFHRSAVNCAAKADKFVIIEGYSKGQQCSTLAANQQGSVVSHHTGHCELQLFLLYFHYSFKLIDIYNNNYFGANKKKLTCAP